ncbi:MAG: hypothetical protein HY303_12845 [Candidatus Wallbacteria bacterium]|nr:hypothetical protein [Candidatus Wallbacteria bacterium]
MIYEYAIEPELVARWGTLSEYRYFAEAFGLGRPRILSELPRVAKWRRRVLKAATELSDLERTRVETLAKLLTERVIARSDRFDGNQTWLENAELQHGLFPFRAILAMSNPRQHAGVVVSGKIGDHPNWTIGTSSTPPRNATGLSAALAPMLRIASEIVMVDPYFGIQHARFRKPMEQILAAIRSGRPGAVPLRIEILTSCETVAEWFFRTECGKHLPALVPVGYKIHCFQLRERPGIEKLHQRYVMTDVGGVRVEPGLDNGDGTYDINLMPRAQYDLRWNQYAGPNRAFDTVGAPIEIVGTCP